ncbi:hypothetical protein [Saccharomonospora viridis]|uniref:Uncharacterized protein n=1 Tax=Saccharomonospora viridis (strain ATCC 15386 / DSM 43017 / JCM 3036 / CCUG 5913 / NBRC 12207 / NCIMB 9602 / P101) TaxID=471857 RepID=C7MU63_SACVD|nr:hypothetical protein [Saccharomonospora viridis]ACU96842.1 hypothetical protein Svir_18190 [Saccharomonospora viridis DSM 43017]
MAVREVLRGCGDVGEFNAFDALVTDGDATNTYGPLNRLITTSGRALTYAGTGVKAISDEQADYSYTPDGVPLG